MNYLFDDIDAREGGDDETLHSTWFLTINPNIMGLHGAGNEYLRIQLKGVLQNIFGNAANLARGMYYNLAVDEELPDNPFESVTAKVSVETGGQYGRVHSHVILEVEHRVGVVHDSILVHTVSNIRKRVLQMYALCL